MWHRKHTTCSLVCDYCGKNESFTIERMMTPDEVSAKIRERRWRTVGQKSFCRECVTEVHG